MYTFTQESCREGEGVTQSLQQEEAQTQAQA